MGGDGLRMPVLFIGHGSPMNAIEDNVFSWAWAELGRGLPRPSAILSISAHWETYGSKVTSVFQPRTIHDFSGFPQELYEVEYPAPGSPELAREVARRVGRVRLDTEWGLDHGTWAVLRRMFPKADVPVVQLSLDRGKPPEYHYKLGRRLAPLRERGILIMGSGNIVHNLMMARVGERAYDWAVEFDEAVKWLVIEGDMELLIHYDRLGEPARLSIPTSEHYLPLLYALALRGKGEPIQFLTERMALASVSMRSLRIG